MKLDIRHKLYDYTLTEHTETISNELSVLTIDIPGAVTGSGCNREIKFLRGCGQ